MKTVKIEGRLLKPIIKIVDNLMGKGLSEQRKEEEMLDMYKEFEDWLGYNYSSVELQPLQKNLVKMALRNHDRKVTKAAAKAITNEIAKLLVIGNKA